LSQICGDFFHDLTLSVLEASPLSPKRTKPESTIPDTSLSESLCIDEQGEQAPPKQVQVGFPQWFLEDSAEQVSETQSEVSSEASSFVPVMKLGALNMGSDHINPKPRLTVLEIAHHAAAKGDLNEVKSCADFENADFFENTSDDEKCLSSEAND
jgi:hypothetical protein